MNRAAIILLFSGILLTGPACSTVHPAPWAGIDEAVIEKVAEEAGRPAHAPFINTDQGDLLLFVFLVAGIVGGFIGGYNFRVLFPPTRQREKEKKEMTRAGRGVGPLGGGAHSKPPEGRT